MQTDGLSVPVLRANDARSDKQGYTLPRSPLPNAVTELVSRRAPNLAASDLSSEDGALAAIDVLEYFVQRGPRPPPAPSRTLRRRC
jgi:hypothetical protein